MCLKLVFHQSTVNALAPSSHQAYTLDEDIYTHERRRGYIHCGSIEYTPAYTLYYRNVYILVFFRVFVFFSLFCDAC